MEIAKQSKEIAEAAKLLSDKLAEKSAENFQNQQKNQQI